MKILYVGELQIGSTCLDRLHALQRLGHEIVAIDRVAFQSRLRVLRSIEYRFNPSLLLGTFNREMLRVADQMGPLSLVWVDKGVGVFPETLEVLKQKSGCSLVHYTPDSQLLINRSHHFNEAIPVYDRLVTTKRFECEMYRAAGAREIRWVNQSFCPRRFDQPRYLADYAYDLGFIGDFKPHYGAVARRLARTFDGIGVWGPRWRRAAWLGQVPKALVKGGGLWGKDYVNALASFKIGLGLLSKIIPEQHTTRSVEIPAAGTFLLAERTAEHQELFDEGKEAEFFDSMDELVSKADFYLANQSAREKIAESGRLRCVQSGYDTDSVMRDILCQIRT